MMGFIEDPDIDGSKPTATLRRPKQVVCPRAMPANKHRTRARNGARMELRDIIVSCLQPKMLIINY